MTKLLSPSRLNDYLGCPHQSALWLAGIDPPNHTDAALELVRTKGFEHEAMVLMRLEAELGAAAKIDEAKDLDLRIADTLAALERKAPLIYQGALNNGTWFGFPDFLVDRPGSRPQPEDAKLARKAKAEHLFQLGIYAELLEQLREIPVGSGAVHVAAGPIQSFDLRQTRYILKRLMAKFESFAGTPSRETRPIPCAACAQCDFKTRCESEWREADSLYFVAGLNAAQAVKLEQANIHTTAQLASLPSGTKVDGIGAETLAKLSAQAKLQLKARDDGKHSIEVLPHTRGRGFTLLPPPDEGDLFFDMEGDPLLEEGLEYLFGVYGRFDGNEEPKFRPLWAHDASEEKAAFEALMRYFVEHVSRHPKAHIYHYALYEPNALKRLAMRYATMEAELDQMLRDRRFVDLYRVAIQAVRASTESYSLKDLEKIYWGERKGDVTTAADSIVEYEKWRVTGDSSILDGIATYNEADCISTARMREWLERLRPTGAVYEIIDDTRPEKQDKSAEAELKEANKRELAARIRASSHGTPEARDVIAELLWFHRRAQKPGWWAVFERQSWSDDELVDDAECLGGLRRDMSMEPVRDKQSLKTTFLFPPQDTKLKVGDTPKIAETLANAGSIVDINAEDGVVVLRRGIKSGPLPDALSLLPAPINLQKVPDAVERFAQRFAGGPSQQDAAMLDIILRNPPRFAGRAPGIPILNDGEAPAAGAIRAVTQLDRSYLFLQGPPGTGKTYTISEVICALIAAGRRVGVSSNSHKAINKVLEEVEKRASAIGLQFSGAKKGNNDDPDTEFNGTNIKTVYASEDVLTSHRLVGGTVFHFSRPDQEQAFDCLIVDEAGQVALGNLVAMAGAARNIVLVGDQMQLPQPVQGVHPGETGLSCLEYLLEGRATVPPEQGILLDESRRLHPDLCAFISEAIYDGRLKSHSDASKRRLTLDGETLPPIKSTGLAFVGVQHSGCTQSSRAEVEEIAKLVANLLKQKVQRANGTTSNLILDDILVVAPYNLQVNLLKQVLSSGAKVGTVDKFQGQEAAVAIVSMTTSKGADAPRGTEFLFNPNRLNVAISRAQCLAIVVHSADIFEGNWTKINDLRRLNLLAHAEAFAKAM